MKINIRQVIIDDLDRIAEIEEICFPKAEAALKESIRSRIETFSNCFFAAEVNNEIIGFINGCKINGTEIYDELYENSKLHIKNGKYQTIFGLDVIPEYRKRGIAAKLMNYMIEKAKEDNCRGLILTCKYKLIHYYEKFGYINKGISKSVHGGTVWYDMILKF